MIQLFLLVLFSNVLQIEKYIMKSSIHRTESPRRVTPETITDLNAKLLFDFFEAQAKTGARIWPGGQMLYLPDLTPFYFQPTLIQRARKEGNIGVRYEFIGTKLIGKGGQSTVFEIDATLAVSEEHITIKNYRSVQPTQTQGLNLFSKRRLVKIVDLAIYSPFEALREYQLSLLAGHLAIKPPTIIGTTSYLVMRLCPGKDLFELLNTDLLQRNVLNIEQRISLSFALLIALKTQVIDKRIIHRDLKPENIIIDFHQNPPIVNIIDFGLSVILDKPDHHCPGSICYAPPEVFEAGPQTLTYDIFSMGRILALIWHVSLDSYMVTKTVDAKANALAVNLDSLFDGIEGIADEARHLIKRTLQAMMHPSSINRISIEDAIAAFSTVKLMGSPSITADPTFRSVRKAPHSIHSLSSTGLFACARRPLPETPAAAIPHSESVSSSICVLQ